MTDHGHAVGLVGTGPWSDALARAFLPAVDRGLALLRLDAHDGGEQPLDAGGARELAERSDLVLFAVGPRGFRPAVAALGEFLHGGHQLVSATRSLPAAGALSRGGIFRQETCCLQWGVLGGPARAADLLAGRPAALVIASEFPALIARVVELFASPALRIYGNPDPVGVELGTALARVAEYAAGLADGMGLGRASQAVLVTRALREMLRLGAALGADAQTLQGLAGLGVLVGGLGATQGPFALGEAQARGRPLSPADREVLAGLRATAETVVAEAARHGASLPIFECARGVLADDLEPRQALEDLMTRASTSEFDGAGSAGPSS